MTYFFVLWVSAVTNLTTMVSVSSKESACNLANGYAFSDEKNVSVRQWKVGEALSFVVDCKPKSECETIKEKLEKVKKCLKEVCSGQELDEIDRE